MGNLTDIGHGLSKYLTAADSSSIPQIDDNRVDIENLHFKLATNNNYAKYDMKDGFIDAFQDTSGVDAGNSTNEIRDGTGEYYSGTLIPTVTGGTITTDGSYTVHSFSQAQSGNNFVTDTAQTVDYLIVAGGASGASSASNSAVASGGGGAGGYRYFTSVSLPAGTYAVTVGAGGNAQSSNASQGNDGGNSSFNSQTSEGGGGGGARSGTTPGRAGGSGGGAAGYTVSPGGAGNSPSTSPAQGFPGATSVSGNYGAGGGGGSSAIGTVTSGGAGTSNSITGSAVTYATGGNGGGSPTGTDGEGDGGGGATGNDSSTVTSGAGGDGIVIIRRPTAGYDNMTLVSATQTAATAPTTGRIMIFEQASTGTTTLNTDIKGWVSRDNGSNYDQITLASEGEYETGKRILSGSVDFTMAASTNIRYKVTTHNQASSKVTRVHGVSMLWS